MAWNPECHKMVSDVIQALYGIQAMAQNPGPSMEHRQLHRTWDKTSLITEIIRQVAKTLDLPQNTGNSVEPGAYHRMPWNRGLGYAT